jgi:AcrR family transcriptional regulator
MAGEQSDRPTPDESRRSERSRRAILEAAKELVATVGYDNMSIEAIAGRAGVGKQTIYRWWPSKAAVVLEMWMPEVHPRIEFPDTGDLTADMKAQLKAVIDLAQDPTFGPSFRALVAESQYDEELSAALVAHIFGPRIEACRQRLRAGQAAGQLRTDIDLDIAIDLFYGGFYHRHLLRVAPLDHAHADAVVDAVFSGLAAPNPTRTRGKRAARP